MNLIKKIPLPISGLILSLFSLGNLIQDFSYCLRFLFGLIGGLFLILILLKLVFYPKSVKEDFKNPVIVSSSGTFSMSLMVLSTYIVSFTPIVSYIIWIIGISIHILLIFYFTYHFIMRNFNLNEVYPSYWIVFVGITMGAITANIHGIHKIDFIFFLIGFISMIIITPVIIYRYIKYPTIKDVNKPLICIFTALYSILIVGYLNSSPQISYRFLFTLYIIACILYLFSIYKLISYRKLEFYPSFSAYTFPFVISALATKGIITKTLNSNMILNSILTIQTIIATLLVIYVLIKYIIFLKK